MKKEETRKQTTPKCVKTKTVFQMEATECGAASFCMVLSYYGKNISLEEAREVTGVCRDGAKAGDLMRAAEKYQLEVHGYRKELDSLFACEPPCIIHWNFNHFVVYEGIKNGKVHINDPAVGHRTLSMEEFSDCYTGIVITMKPLEDFEKKKAANSFVQLGSQRLKGQMSSILALILTGVMLVLPSYLIAGASQIFVDEIFVSQRKEWIYGLMLLLFGSLTFQIVFNIMRNAILLRLQNKMTLLSNREFLQHMFCLPMAFFEQRYAGDLSNRVGNNDKVNVFLGGELANTVICLLESCFYLLILFVYSPQLVIVALIGLMINMILIVFSSEYLKEISMKYNQDSGKLIGALYSGLSIIDSIKATGTENSFLEKLLGYFAKTCNTEQKMSRTQQMLNAFPKAIMQILNVVLLMVGSIFVISGQMTVGSLTAFMALFAGFLSPVNTLLGFVYNIQMTKADMERVRDILNYPREEKYQKETNGYQGKLKGKIELKDVSFGYGKGKEPDIKNINLSVKPGESIAIVGASGSGKSTLAKVICGLYEPWEGDIYLDQKRIQDIPAETMHMSVADISQHVTIFGTSIRNNITLWNEAIPDEDVVGAAIDACIHDVITSRPGAYDGMLAEGGKSLSGGQRQRIEIARALVLNPTIIIMDEATSALDPIVEKQVIDHISARGITSIVVAHRLSAIRDCKEILVMDRGRIVEQGTHEELMKHGVLYQKLIQLN